MLAKSECPISINSVLPETWRYATSGRSWKLGAESNLVGNLILSRLSLSKMKVDLIEFNSYPKQHSAFHTTC